MTGDSRKQSQASFFFLLYLLEELACNQVKPVLFPFSLVVGGSMVLFYSAANACVSAVRHGRGHNFEDAFLAAPSRLRLRLCHPR